MSRRSAHRRLVGLLGLASLAFAGCAAGAGPATSVAPTASLAPIMTLPPLLETPATPVVSPALVPTTMPASSPAASAAMACSSDSLMAWIDHWEGAAGHRIATVGLESRAAGPCELPATSRVSLVDGHGRVLIQGATPADQGTITLAPGDAVNGLVDAANYCGAAPAAAVSVVFDIAPDAVIATPASANDTTVPPCNGPTLPGTIVMRAWQR